MSKIMLVTCKAMFVMLITAMAVLGADYCYKQTLPQPGDVPTASIEVARSGS